MKTYPFADRVDGSAWTIGIAVAKWNAEITDVLLQGAVDTCQAAGAQVRVAPVPGAFELPLASKWLLDSGADAVVALGAVIRGDTPHFEYVSLAVTRGLSDLALASGKPVGFGVLTVNTVQQALDRIGPPMGNKGAEAADTVLRMLALRFEMMGIKR